MCRENLTLRFGGLGVIAPPAFAAGGAGGIDAAVFATNSEIKAERGGEGAGGRGGLWRSRGPGSNESSASVGSRWPPVPSAPFFAMSPDPSKEDEPPEPFSQVQRRRQCGRAAKLPLQHTPCEFKRITEVLNSKFEAQKTCKRRTEVVTSEG